MSQIVRDITSQELTLFGGIVSDLERLEHDKDVRAFIFEQVIRLVRADFGASYVWNAQKRRFEEGIIHNMDPANIRRYDEWFQFRDPHTHALRRRRRATLVEEVNPRRDLVKTEFYNDFLKVDGLSNGVNLFLFDGARDIGDFRLWRASHREEFGERETILLDALAPHLQRAILRLNRPFEQLTPRERDVSFLVAKGYRDREIGEMLSISFATVRTHLNKAMEKKGCSNRAELAASVTQGRPSAH